MQFLLCFLLLGINFLSNCSVWRSFTKSRTLFNVMLSLNPIWPPQTRARTICSLYCLINEQTRSYFITSPPERVVRYCFHPVCLCVCLSVCLCVCPANILEFYFSAIRRYIDLKFIQDANRDVLNSLENIDLHMIKVNVTGTVHCFLKAQSYHKNWVIENFNIFS